MNDPFQLVTNCTFKGKDYLVQMCVFTSKKLELTVTDKLMAEDWQCEYDASYIETLTHKTGNFKNFNVFVVMLKSGLLKTSDCITLDLLTLEDLEELRNKKIINSNHTARVLNLGNQNKRYLILTYSVEFDRIHYPLPLDYCGPPDPILLQSNIRKLEAEVQRLKKKNSNSNIIRSENVESRKLKERIEQLLEDNNFLSSEIRRLNKIISKSAKPVRNNLILQHTLKRLEEQVLQEKNNFHHSIWKLKEENKQLRSQIEELKTSEQCLKLRLKNASKYSSQKIPKKMLPDPLSPEQSLDCRKNVRGERSESHLSCRAISSWNSTVSTRPQGVRNIVRRSDNKLRSLSSSESEISKPQQLDMQIRKSLPTSKLQMKRSSNTFNKVPSSRRSSCERQRHSSCENKPNFEGDLGRSLIRKNRPYKVQTRDSSCGSGSPAGRHSRESSISSRDSSRRSRDSRCSEHFSGDKTISKSRPLSKITLSDREDLKLSVSDLESRIHALQKILSEGLNF